MSKSILKPAAVACLTIAAGLGTGGCATPPFAKNPPAMQLWRQISAGIEASVSPGSVGKYQWSGRSRKNSLNTNPASADAPVQTQNPREGVSAAFESTTPQQRAEYLIQEEKRKAAAARGWAAVLGASTGATDNSRGPEVVDSNRPQCPTCGTETRLPGESKTSPKDPADVDLATLKPEDLYGEWVAQGRESLIVDHFHPDGTLDVFNASLEEYPPKFRKHERMLWKLIPGPRPIIYFRQTDDQVALKQSIPWSQFVPGAYYEDESEPMRAALFNPFSGGPRLDTLFLYQDKVPLMRRSDRDACRFLVSQVKQLLPTLENLDKAFPEDRRVNDLRQKIARRAKELLDLEALKKEQYDQLLATFSANVTPGASAAFFAVKYCTESQILQVACGTSHILTEARLMQLHPVTYGIIKGLSLAKDAKDISYALTILGWNRFITIPAITKEIEQYTAELIRMTRDTDREIKRMLQYHAEMAADIGNLQCRNFDSGIGTYPQSQDIRNFDLCWLQKSMDSQVSICQ